MQIFPIFIFLINEKKGFNLFHIIFLKTRSQSAAPKPGPNPFAADLRRPPAPLITDQRTRDKVLKQPYAAKNVPDNLDAIVIGRHVSMPRD